MPDAKEQSETNVRREQLARLAELLGVEVADDDLATLATQLDALDALEESELRDQPPILTMDAGWHD